MPPPTLWPELAVGPDRCRGRRCPLIDACFAEKARQRPARPTSCWSTTPCSSPTSALRRPRTAACRSCRPTTLVIFDEAHALEDVAAEWLGARLVDARPDPARARRRAGLRQRRAGPGRARAAHPELHSRAPVRRAARGRRMRLRERHLRGAPARARRRPAGGARRRRGRRSRGGGGVRPRSPGTPTRWRWRSRPSCDRRGRGDGRLVGARDRRRGGLRTAPIDVAPLLREALLGLARRRRAGARRRWRSAATCRSPAAGSGCAGRRAALDAPFDYAARRSCTSRPMPRTRGGPGREEGRSPAGCERVVQASRGRALCLFTSHRGLGGGARAGGAGSRGTCAAPGRRAPRAAARRFRADVDSVLFATASSGRASTCGASLLLRGDRPSAVRARRRPAVRGALRAAPATAARRSTSTRCRGRRCCSSRASAGCCGPRPTAAWSRCSTAGWSRSRTAATSRRRCPTCHGCRDPDEVAAFLGARIGEQRLG